MTITENAAFTTPVDVPAERGARRLPVTDVASYLDELPDDTRDGLRPLGELLVGVTQRPARAESADRFIARCLGVADVGTSSMRTAT
jgi:cell division protease FtsH